MTDFNFETLLVEKNLSYDDRWSPASVTSYSYLIKRGILKDMNYALSRNIAYSMQYLEFIDFELRSLKLHNIVQKMLYKTFIITSISIVEAIFYYILKNNGKHKTITEELIFTSRANKKSFNNEEVIVETNLFKIIEPKEYEMTFDVMIKKMEKSKYLDLKHEYFPYLKKFKDLRNRVHLLITNNNATETDYWKFEKEDYLFVKYMLLNLLIDEKIQNTSYDDALGKIVPQEYEFLILNNDERNCVMKKYGVEKTKQE